MRIEDFAFGGISPYLYQCNFPDVSGIGPDLCMSNWKEKPT